MQDDGGGLPVDPGPVVVALVARSAARRSGRAASGRGVSSARWLRQPLVLEGDRDIVAQIGRDVLDPGPRQGGLRPFLPGRLQG